MSIFEGLNFERTILNDLVDMIMNNFVITVLLLFCIYTIISVGFYYLFTKKSNGNDKDRNITEPRLGEIQQNVL